MTAARLSSLWADGLLVVSWQFAVLVTLAALTERLFLRRSSPGLRYVLWVGVLLRLCLPLGVTAPWGFLATPTTQAPIVSFIPEASGLHSSSAQAALPTETPESSAVRAADEPESSLPLPVSSSALLFGVWLTSVVTLLLLHLRRRIALRTRLRHHESDVPSSVLAIYEDEVQRLGLSHPPNLQGHRDVGLTSPIILGAFRPRILLPVGLSAWPASRLRLVVRHELHHARRWDPLVRAFQNALQILFFFHPFVWWTNRRIHALREEAVDDLTLSPESSVRPYVELLLECGGAHSSRVPRDALAMASPPNDLGRRLQRLTSSGYRPEVAKTWQRAAAAFLAGALATVVAAPDRGANAQPPRQSSDRLRPPFEVVEFGPHAPRPFLHILEKGEPPTLQKLDRPSQAFFLRDGASATDFELLGLGRPPWRSAARKGDSLLMIWSADGTRGQGNCSGQPSCFNTVGRLLHMLGVPPWLQRGDTDTTTNLHREALVWNRDAERRALLSDLQLALRRHGGASVELGTETVVAPVLVVSGTLDLPSPNRPRTIDIERGRAQVRLTRLDDDVHLVVRHGELGSGRHGRVASIEDRSSLAEAIGSFFRAPGVSDVDGALGRRLDLSCRCSASIEELDPDLARAFREATGLQLTIEQRQVEIVRVRAL